MRLRDLEAGLIWQVQTRPDGSAVSYRADCPDLAQASGIMFLCPKCFAQNQGAVGTHQVICWFRGRVPDKFEPGPGRWTPQGSGIDDLTFVPGDPAQMVSVLLEGGCGWHGFVRSGDAT